MTERSIYRDISQRTNGDIYIGVVGPVRTGKSTFIKKFMDTIVIPNIKDDSLKVRTNDELPQSSGGRTIMTTEPKFIPEEAMEISLPDKAHLKVRMIDCVGYVVKDSMGYMEDDMPRMVKTPWSKEEMPFDKAAEIGTKKVINDHSTIGLVITTDGSISDITRESYQEAEERVVKELKAINKPFVVLLNSIEPSSPSVISLSEQLSGKYQVPVIPVNCLTMEENEIKRVLAQVLFEFPIKEINIDMPKWVVNLDKEHWLKKQIFTTIKENAMSMEKLRQVQETCQGIGKDEFVDTSEIKEYTPHTITNYDELLDCLKQVRRQGYALDDEENELGVRCIAVSLSDYSGIYRYAMSITAPVTRMSDSRILELADVLLKMKADFHH